MFTIFPVVTLTNARRRCGQGYALKKWIGNEDDPVRLFEEASDDNEAVLMNGREGGARISSKSGLNSSDEVSGPERKFQFRNIERSDSSPFMKDRPLWSKKLPRF
jgi:hypothetical protein